ncbi:MAG: cyclopropane-fatty-acyl-phospholipid synthase family protein [Hyphomonadaceae bacterium]|nr:cyclopropane-fatty-acyl-phospholipid synthase family protein [Hyphomonadaceae bacterium]
MSQTIHASRQTLSTLKGVPAVFRVGGLALLRARRGQIGFELPDGRTVLFDHGQPGPAAHVVVHDFEFVKRTLAGGDVGFAEAYMDGLWSTEDLTAVLEFFSENFEAAGRLARGGAVIRFLNRIRHALNRNSKAQAKRNIMAHYDLGNDFYELWLDPSMTYSSGIYASTNTSLEQAQAAKYEGIVEKLGAGPDCHLLEIGCGWGGFAEYAARTRGARVTCLTISEAQADYARKRMQAAGLNERVEIRLQDYRDHEGSYDGVASIEMFEAVGESYWPSYFGKIHNVLKEGGRAALQIITIRDDLFESYRNRADFIQRYIFPGGMLPSEEKLKEQFAGAGLRYDGTHYFGQDYAQTLRAWSQRFTDAWDEIAPMGFDEPFRRMWSFYLAYCEAGFQNGRINVGQFSLARV